MPSIFSRFRILIPLTLLAIGIFSFARPALAVNTILTKVYQDTNNNGAVDRILWTMDENVTACAYDAADWTVNTAGSMNVVITGTECSGSDASLFLIVTADANETGGAISPVISYANGGTANSVTLTSGAMTGKSSQTANDNAKPIIINSNFTYGTGYGYAQNKFEITYSESNLKVSLDGGGDADVTVGPSFTTTATLGAMTTARTLAGIVTWAALNGGDMTTSSATGNYVTYNGTDLSIIFNIASTSAYFSSGTIAPTTPVLTAIENAANISDTANNPVNSLSTYTSGNPASWDVTPPTLSTTYSCDADTDGGIDRIQMNWSESMIDGSANTISLYEGDDDSTNNGVGEQTATSWATTTSGCDGAAADADADDEKMSVNFTTEITGTEAAFLNLQTAGPRDWVGNRAVLVAGGGTETDKASPRLMSSSPAQGGNASRTSPISLTFSESVTSVTASVSPTTTLVASGAPGITVTLTPSGSLSRGSNTLTISAAPDSSANLFGGATGAVNPFTFNVTGGSSSTVTETPVTYAITVTAPAGGESLAPGDTTTVTWTSEGSAMSYVSLYYSTDGGSTYETIAEDQADNGSYLWTVPDISSSTTTLYITGTDLITVLATDASEIFTVSYSTTSSTDTTTGTDDTTSEEPVVPEPSGTTGISPVTGLEEDISVVSSGDYIKSPSFATVYYIDDLLQRHPFIDTQTFFTFEDDFSSIVTVTDATLSTLTIADPMLPNPGVALIKIQSDDNVYAIDVTEGLRWVTTEAIAVAMYGQSWSDYAIDLPSTLFPHFTVGSAIESAESINTSAMKTRFALSIENPDDDTDGDGITNAEEVQLGTSLDDADTDDDGYPDALEVGSGHDPLTALDSDSDGYPNYIEILHGYDPYTAAIF